MQEELLLLGGELLELRGDGVGVLRLELGHGEVEGLVRFVGGENDVGRGLLQ